MARIIKPFKYYLTTCGYQTGLRNKHAKSNTWHVNHYYTHQLAVKKWKHACYPKWFLQIWSHISNNLATSSWLYKKTNYIVLLLPVTISYSLISTKNRTLKFYNLQKFWELSNLCTDCTVDNNPKQIDFQYTIPLGTCKEG